MFLSVKTAQTYILGPVYTSAYSFYNENDLRLHYRKHVSRDHSCRHNHRYVWIDPIRVCVLGAVGWGIYIYISMGTTTSMMLMCTRSSRIRRANVISKSLRFGPFTLKRYARVFKLKRGLQRFQKSLFWSVYTETLRRSFQTKTRSAAFSKVFVLVRLHWNATPEFSN